MIRCVGVQSCADLHILYRPVCSANKYMFLSVVSVRKTIVAQFRFLRDALRTVKNCVCLIRWSRAFFGILTLTLAVDGAIAVLRWWKEGKCNQ